MIVFDEQFQNTGVTINAMHPGAVKTEQVRKTDLFTVGLKGILLIKH